MNDKIRTFLIIDDQKIIRQSLSEKLSCLFVNSEIKDVSSGKEALTLLDSWVPAIIFMDISMPKMDGIETTKKILAKYPFQQIIAFSMNDNDEMLNKMMEAGAKGYLLKTDDMEDYKIAINNVLNGEIFISSNIRK